MESGIQRAGQDYNTIRQAIAAIPEDLDRLGVARGDAERLAARVAASHKRRFTRAMQRSLGVDIRPFLNEVHITPVLERAVEANVSLIKVNP